MGLLAPFYGQKATGKVDRRRKPASRKRHGKTVDLLATTDRADTMNYAARSNDQVSEKTCYKKR